MLNLQTKPKRLNEILNPYDGRKPNLPALVTSSGDIAVTSEALTTYVYHTYGLLSTYYPDNFFNCFARHVELYQRSIDRIYYAWHADYDVLDNVNAIEERTISTTGNKENTANSNATNTVTGNSETNNYESTITNTNPVQTAKDASSTSGNNTLASETNTQETTSNTTTDTYKRHGNIGITKSTDLISSELDLRRNFALKQVIDVIVEMCGVFYDNEV